MTVAAEFSERFQIGQTVSSKTVRYVLKRLIGESYNGAVCEAENERKEHFAIKFEWRSQQKKVPPKLGMEISILKDIRQNTVSPHFVDYVDKCARPDAYFMVTSLVGESLERKLINGGFFSESTALNVAMQILDALRDLHSIGYVHRDIRPGNICPGLDGKIRTLFLMNFGCAAIYGKGSKIRRPRPRVQIKTQLKFCTLSGHAEIEQSPKDDVESLIYTMIALCNGLPWQWQTDKEEIANQKKKLRIEGEVANKAFRNMNIKALSELLCHLDTIGYYEKVDYEGVKSVLLNAESSKSAEKPFEWETEQKKIPAIAQKPIERKTEEDEEEEDSASERQVQSQMNFFQ